MANTTTNRPAARYKVGYIYEQAWEMDGRTGITTYCILHLLNAEGIPRKSFTYKVAPQFVPFLSLGESSARQEITPTKPVYCTLLN